MLGTVFTLYCIRGVFRSIRLLVEPFHLGIVKVYIPKRTLLAAFKKMKAVFKNVMLKPSTNINRRKDSFVHSFNCKNSLIVYPFFAAKYRGAIEQI